MTIIPGVATEEDLADLQENPPSYTMLLQLEERFETYVSRVFQASNVLTFNSMTKKASTTSRPSVQTSRVSEIETIDRTRTYTNNIIEIFDYLGIEAARQAIINELESTLLSARLEVDVRHLLMVADVMTSKVKYEPLVDTVFQEPSTVSLLVLRSKSPSTTCSRQVSSVRQTV